MKNKGSVWRRAMALAVAALLLVVMFVATALADGETEEPVEYGVWIGGKQITSANMDNVLGDTGTPTVTAFYNEEDDTMIVKLYDPVLDGVCSDAVIYSNGVNLHLDIESGLTIKETGKQHLNAIYVEAGADLFINGSMTAESKYGSVISCDGKVTVRGVLDLSSTYGAAIDAAGTIDINRDITVHNALTHGGFVQAIRSRKGDVKINGDVNLTIDKVGGGIWAENGTVTITGNTTISTGAGDAIRAKAIVLDGKKHSVKGPCGLITATDGDVTINGDITAEITGSSSGTTDVAILASKGTVKITGNASVTTPMTNSCAISGKSIILDGTSHTITGCYGLSVSGGDISIRGDVKMTTQYRCINALNREAEEAYDVFCNGNLTLTSEAGEGIVANDVDITGNVNIEAESSCIMASNLIRIDGNVTATTKGVTRPALTAPKVTVVSGTWTLSGTRHAIDANPNGISIPASHGVVLPEGGKIAEYTDGSYPWMTVVDADGNPANDAVIGALTVKYTVTVTDNGYGKASADVTSGVTGTVVTLTATPNEGYRFKEWNILEGGMGKTEDGTGLIPGISIDADNQFTIENKNVKIEAVFEAVSESAGGESDPTQQSEEVQYTVVSGANGSVTQGNVMTITVKRSVDDNTCFAHFTGVQIDGKACAAGDYDAKAGSTIVTLKAATIENLSVGTHTISILFDDGKAETKVTVEAKASEETDPTENAGTGETGSNQNAGSDEAGKSNGNGNVQSPKTGDDRTDFFWVLLILTALCACGVVVMNGKCRNTGA
ncbi:MAG: hypothetical protein J5531_05945 [Lachnospiraceae bacterium]|nr:hypothetical protein [Lachnospiraceae bacterium]